MLHASCATSAAASSYSPQSSSSLLSPNWLPPPQRLDEQTASRASQALDIRLSSRPTLSEILRLLTPQRYHFWRAVSTGRTPKIWKNAHSSWHFSQSPRFPAFYLLKSRFCPALPIHFGSLTGMPAESNTPIARALDPLGLHIPL